ncbi:hypothetical protein Fcan01_22528 [Folsomia candida]|uniref:Ionotropic glutamate receptor C-terminal domain-containing protein n=1 Tax=Folsomia candida TaxID=158441 RepID=A0A226DBX2_FOLCA|nr:hypothetical protein Fcan01_22528 [Folsomia candida]
MARVIRFVNYYAFQLVVFGFNFSYQLKFSEFDLNTSTLQDRQKCLIIFTEISKRSNIRSHDEIDNLLRSMSSLVLDFYDKLNQTTRRTDARSQVHMTLKVIMSHLNVSYSKCPKGDSAHHVDINWSVDTFQKQLDRRKGSELFWSGNIVQVKFMSCRRVNRFLTFLLLVGPLGFNIFLATLVLIAVHILTLGLTLNLELKLVGSNGNTNNINSKDQYTTISSVVVRPLLDQCEERHQTLPSIKFYFRLILCNWLFYCLIITDTYRSSLVSYLMRPQIGISWLKTFPELKTDQERRRILALGFRPGQTTSIDEFINSEIESCRHTNPKRVELLQHILQEIADTKALADEKLYDINKQFTSGNMILVADSFLLSACARGFERFVGGRFYELSTESISNRVYWTVSPGPFQRRVTKVMRRLRDAGILDHFQGQQDLIDYSLLFHQLTRNFLSNKDGHETRRSQQELVSELAGNGPQSLKLKHIYALLLLLLIGWGIGFISFWKEFICQRKFGKFNDI